MYKDKKKRKDFLRFEIKTIQPLPKEDKEELKTLLKELTDNDSEKIIENLKEEGFIITKRI